MYNFYLDDKLLESTPDGWVDFQQQVSRDIENRRMTITYPTNLTFYGDGFNILFDAIELYGYDKIFKFRAEKINDVGDKSTAILGILFLIDVEFDLTKRTAVVQIKEDGFIARIWGNLNIPITLPARGTKNGLRTKSVGTGRGGIQQVEPNVDALGSDSPVHMGLRYGVDVWSAMKQMVYMMSDNNVTLTSDFFDTLYSNFEKYPDDKYLSPLWMVRGKELRLGINDREGDNDYKITTTFDKLFKAVANIYNLYLYPNASNPDAELIIGTSDQFFPTDNPTAQMESPEGITMSYYQELFYSHVRMGCGTYKFEKGNTATNLPQVDFVTFQQQDYILGGENNIDRRLDLGIGDFITDSNVIRDVLINDNDSYDDQLFLIQYDYYYRTPKRLASFEMLGEDCYNGSLFTSEIAKNHHLSNSITKNITDVTIDNTMHYKSTPADIQQRFCLDESPCIENISPKFSEKIFDKSDGQYDELNAIYTAELSGQYTFDISIVTNIYQMQEYQYVYDGTAGGVSVPTNDTLQMRADLIIKDGSDIIQRLPLFLYIYRTRGVWIADTIVSATMNANETAEIELYYDGFSASLEGVKDYSEGEASNGLIKWDDAGFLRYPVYWEFYRNSHFKCIDSEGLSLSFPSTADPDTYKGTRIVLNHYLNQLQIKNVLANPERPIELLNFVETDKNKICWIKDLVINNETGNIEAELITNIVTR
jgi:hypothetical protein